MAETWDLQFAWFCSGAACVSLILTLTGVADAVPPLIAFGAAAVGWWVWWLVKSRSESDPILPADQLTYARKVWYPSKGQWRLAVVEYPEDPVGEYFFVTPRDDIYTQVRVARTDLRDGDKFFQDPPPPPRVEEEPR